MKIDWDATKAAFGSFGGYVDDCKSTDYDTDGGFWDGVGDWWGGEDFDYSTVNTALGHFYSCVSTKLRNEAVDQFKNKFFAACPAF